MGGFGDLLGGLADMLGGFAEAGGERAVESVAEGVLGAGDAGGDDAADAGYERYLTGAPRALNVNDI